MAEEPVVNATSTEEPVKESPAEEPVKESPAEEPVVNATSTEEPVKESPAEEPVVNATSTEEPVTEEVKSHLFAIRTTGGQEKVVMRILETRARSNKINIQSVLWVNDLKGYVVVEAQDTSAAYQAIEGVRHIRGQLRGEMEFKDIEGYLIKKSTVAQLAVDQTVEITGGPFKGMKATVSRVDKEKEEATVVLLDASYQLPVTVDANYLKISVSS
ncbi:MAG: Transcription elongation factor Spt5 [Nitrosopumilales archaeon]|nr:MAG: Transcription elongation factor Spt5 [Nitrosopumilales archaeon]